LSTASHQGNCKARASVAILLVLNI
jgi:hypothetical protein